jgi:hypothetical protein
LGTKRNILLDAVVKSEVWDDCLAEGEELGSNLLRVEQRSSKQFVKLAIEALAPAAGPKALS